MSEDMTIEQMVSAGFIHQVSKDRWQLTEKGQKAFEKWVAEDPARTAKEFPEWVKIEWVH